MFNTSKYAAIIFILIAIQACAITDHSSSHRNSWYQVYENDADGHVLQGSKQALIEAVLSGKDIRITTGDKQFGHASDVIFLTVFDGEVFAQTVEIQSQAPARNPAKIEFREPGKKWRAIRGSNGFVTAYIDGKEPNVRNGQTKWFVQY